MHVRPHLRPRGIFTADVLVGLAVVVILSATLAIAVTRQQRASQRLAESRTAMRFAEATLTARQTGQPAPAAPEGMTLDVRDAGNGWITVTVHQGAREVQLTGPAGAGAKP